MDTEHTSDDFVQRLRFYGAGDFATYWQVEQAAKVVRDFDPSSPPNDINGILELHNARLFVDSGFVPAGTNDDDRAALESAVIAIRRTVALWFNALTDDNLSANLSTVDWQYHKQVVDLLASLGVFGRCSAEAMLSALDCADVQLGDMLTSKRMVEAYDAALRAQLLAGEGRAEFVIHHHLEGDKRTETYLPASFSPADSRALLDAYIKSPEPNPNYLRLIAEAPIDAKTGVDAKLVVKAKRRHDAVVAKFFEKTPGIKTGCSVAVVADQVEPLKVSSNDLVLEYTFSQAWLEETSDFPSALNNFQFLFEFAPDYGLLTLPAFDGERRGIVDLIGMSGAKAYRTGQVFTAKDQSTLLMTAMYQRYLASNGTDLEEVLRWYYEQHLPDEYGITGFVFHPSSPTANYLERCRNLFAEMESIATQFRLLVEDGEIDHDVAAAGADLVRYRTIPSALEGKYVYTSDQPELREVLHILFSDQSSLTYINDNLRGESAADLLVRNHVSYESLHPYQKPLVDRLIEIGVVENTGARVQLKDLDLFRALLSLRKYEVASYHRLNDASQAHIDTMIESGWLVRHSSLLTDAEAAYFNFNLNSVEFSNGPKLRNKYQHGLQPKGSGAAEHQDTYFRALRLMIGLTIKINDEFRLRDMLKANASPAREAPTHDSTPSG